MPKTAILVKKTAKKRVLTESIGNMIFKIFLIMCNTNAHPELRGIVKICHMKAVSQNGIELPHPLKIGRSKIC